MFRLYVHYIQVDEDCCTSLPSHHDTAILLQFSQDPRQKFLDRCLDLVLLLSMPAASMLLTGVSSMLLTAVRPAMMLLLVVARRRAVASALRAAGRWWQAVHRLALQIDIDTPCVLFRRVLQAELPAHLFHARLELLDVSRGVIACGRSGAVAEPAAGRSTFAYDADYREQVATVSE